MIDEMVNEAMDGMDESYDDLESDKVKLLLLIIL
jgi:hypothetical protein